MARVLRTSKTEENTIDGGEPVTLCDAPAGRGASWGEDSNTIVALDAQAGFSQLPAEGGSRFPSRSWPLERFPTAGRTSCRETRLVLFTSSIAYANYDGAEIALVSLTNHQRITRNFEHGWFLTYSPILTANWRAPSDNQWLVPWKSSLPATCNSRSPATNFPRNTRLRTRTGRKNPIRAAIHRVWSGSALALLWVFSCC
jgi:hypothetical protein